MSSSKNFKIAVCGAGIAGLSVATLLKEHGCDVVLFDKFKAPEPLGSGLILQPTGLAVLQQMALRHQAEETGARINRLHGKTATSGRTVLDVHYRHLSPDLYGIAIHRAALFNLLLGAMENAGCTLEPQSSVTGTAKHADSKMSVTFETGKDRGGFDLVIDALGIHSPLNSGKIKPLAYGALWANVPYQQNSGFADDTLDQRYRQAREMVGVMPIGKTPGSDAQTAAFFWSLKHQDFDAWKAGGIDAWKSKVFALWPQLEPTLQIITHTDDLVMAQYAHRTLSNPASGRVVHLGDSYHSASPQLGQGANMALLDAWALSKAIKENSDLDAAIKEFADSRRWHVRLYQTMSWLFTPVYQSDGYLSPLLRDLIAAPLSRIPPAPRLLASMVAGTLGSPLKRLGLR